MIPTHEFKCRACEKVQTYEPRSPFCNRCYLPYKPLVVKEVTETIVERVEVREVEKFVDRILPCAMCGSGMETLPTLAEIEELVIKRAIEICGGSLHKAAAMLGIGKTTMYRKVRDMEAAQASLGDGTAA